MASPRFWIEINLLNFHVLVRRGLFCCHDLLHNVMYMYMLYTACIWLYCNGSF